VSIRKIEKEAEPGYAHKNGEKETVSRNLGVFPKAGAYRRQNERRGSYGKAYPRATLCARQKGLRGALEKSEAMSTGPAHETPHRAPIANLLTPGEAAIELRVPKSTILRAVTGTLPGSHRLPAIRIGRRVLIRRESLLRYLRRRRTAFSSAIATRRSRLFKVQQQKDNSAMWASPPTRRDRDAGHRSICNENQLRRQWHRPPDLLRRGQPLWARIPFRTLVRRNREASLNFSGSS
jgi:excisionase family DNA binding protein